MAGVPIEVVIIGDIDAADVVAALAVANSAQKEFLFSQFPEDQASSLKMHAYSSVQDSDMFDILESFRKDIRGYHPFLIAIIDANLHGALYGNLFGNHLKGKGIAVVTVANVPDIIIPRDRMMAFFLYYLARYALSFMAPDHMNHEDSRGCVFDRKVKKPDLVKSMRARALCDECRRNLVSEPGMMSAKQFEALDTIFSMAGQILNAGLENNTRPRVFIGSSTEGLELANKIQELLSNDLSVVVWNQGTVFGLGDATLEALEAAVMGYQFGIFIFTPDDELYTRGETKSVVRDNVLFELGLFIGKLGRHRAFVVNPGKKAVVLPSDLLGITTATYDPNENDLAAALGPVCNRLRNAIKSAII
jgi:predicted nucleotide-binding protein